MKRKPGMVDLNKGTGRNWLIIVLTALTAWYFIGNIIGWW